MLYFVKSPLVEVGDALFRHGEPSDPALLRWYRLYKLVKAALALPVGLVRVAALHAAKTGDDKKYLARDESSRAP